MFDIKTLTATPGLARRLLTFSQMNHMEFGNDLIQLAMDGLLSQSDIQGFPIPLDASQLSSLQFIRDWESRGMILCSTPERARAVALANAWMNDSSTLILAQPKFYGQWATLVREVWPEAKICVFGNPRYNEKDVAYPEGVEFSDRPDFEADVFITSYGGVIWHNFLNHKTVNQTIVEELDNNRAVNYKWDTAVKGIFHELARPVFIQDIHQLPNDSGRDNLTSLQINGSKGIEFVRRHITELMWAGINPMGNMLSGPTRETEDYLVGRGYTSVDNFKLLSLFGVSTHLLDDAEGHKKPLTFKDHTIRFLNQNKRRESGLNRFGERERALEERTGLKLHEVVHAAIEGDRPSQTLIGALQNTQWANLKAQHLKTVHGNVANRSSRALFLCEHADLKRALALQFGLQLEDMSKSDDKAFILARYLYPAMTTEYLHLPSSKQRMIRPLANLVVSVDDLIAEPRLMDSSNFLFITEAVFDSDYLSAIKEAAQTSGTRIVKSVIAETFEEEIHKQLR